MRYVAIVVCHRPPVDSLSPWPIVDDPSRISPLSAKLRPPVFSSFVSLAKSLSSSDARRSTVGACPRNAISWRGVRPSLFEDWQCWELWRYPACAMGSRQQKAQSRMCLRRVPYVAQEPPRHTTISSPRHFFVLLLPSTWRRVEILFVSVIFSLQPAAYVNPALPLAQWSLKQP